MRFKFAAAFLTLFALFGLTGCASTPSTEIHQRNPAAKSALVPMGLSAGNRSYQVSVTCQTINSATDSHVKLSPLSYYAVGPTARINFPNLDQATLRPFRSDGCSSSADDLPPHFFSEKPGVWRDCCIRHDAIYWLGGPFEEKQKADSEFEACIAESGFPRVGKLYHAFVKKFGGPLNTSIYRWGYGWNRQRPYGELSTHEVDQVRALYGMDRAQIQNGEFTSTLLTSAYILERACDARDPVFEKLSNEEKRIYQYLNSQLDHDDVIEWAKWGYFNWDKRDFELKLKSCPSSLTVTLHKKTGEILGVQTDCFVPKSLGPSK